MQLAAPSSARTRPTADGPARPVRELLAMVLVLAGYFGLRLVVEGERAAAVRNAERLLELEARLGIDIELAVQEVVLDHQSLSSFLSWAYVWLHWPLLVAAMVFLTFRAPAVQARLRDAILMSGALGVVLFATIPMAPPRFMPGYVGTVSDAARRHYLPYSLDWTNQFAAFPSYHIGWTLVACLAVAGAVSGRWRWLLLTPAAVVAVAVVGTGNHYVLDSVAGAAFALAAWWIAGRRSGPVPDGPSPVEPPGRATPCDDTGDRRADCADDRTDGSATCDRSRAERDLRRGPRPSRARRDRRLGHADVGDGRPGGAGG